ncbi:MAG TPA: phosphoglucosamine mutase [Ilumatobacter sp.]|nr:phosphoglucosamine mutase [Ilumatobacter sp.]
MRFGTDGVRGVANTELTAAFALRLGRAAARVLAAPTAVVGGDSRLSTPMLEAAFVAGLAAEGVTVYRLGVTPTPAVAFEAARTGAMGAVISASHNPYYDNGIKLFAPGGTKLADEIERLIEDELTVVGDQPSGVAEPGQIHSRTSSSAYVDHLLGVLAGRSLAGLRVVVDAANGAASHVAASVFERAGAGVVAINVAPDGRNINAGCGATAPAGLQVLVPAERAHAGLALDGDADRLIAVDETGAVVDGDHILAICAADLQARGLLADATVVVTPYTNLGFHLAMQERGVKVVEAGVGDRYILEALAAGGYSLGGEQSGHVIFPAHATTGDGLLTGLVLLDVLQRSGKQLSQLAREAMTQLPQVLVNVKVPSGSAADAALAIEGDVAAAASALGATGRVLVRPSGTEPLVRVMVEAPTAAEAQSVADHLAAAVRARVS